MRVGFIESDTYLLVTSELLCDYHCLTVYGVGLTALRIDGIFCNHPVLPYLPEV
jgi:hypothetical protein